MQKRFDSSSSADDDDFDGNQFHFQQSVFESCLLDLKLQVSCSLC